MRGAREHCPAPVKSDDREEKTEGEGGVSDGGSPREVGGEMRRRREVGSGSFVSGKELRVRGVVVDEEDAELPGSNSSLARTEDSSVILLARGGRRWRPESRRRRTEPFGFHGDGGS